MPKISIIIPVYNVEKYIRQCLESVVNQTLKDIEIIIIDDGSPDNSAAIYQQYADKDERIKVIRKKNAGVSAARNDGIELASGEFLLFADSDDWLDLDACRKMYEAAISEKADMVLADAEMVTDGKHKRLHVFADSFVTENKAFIGDYQKACIGYGYNPKPAEKWVVSGLGSPWNKLYRRETVRKYGLKFDSYVLGIYDDNLFCLHFLEYTNRLVYIKEVVYFYRIVTTSLTTGFKENTLEINQRIFRRIHEFINTYHQEEKAYFEEAFQIYVIRRLDKSLGAYFFANANQKSLAERIGELNRTILSEPYKTALCTVDDRRLLPTQLVTCKAARLKSGYLVWILFKMRLFLKKVLRK